MINISSKREGPEGELSNFPERIFVFEGWVCKSLEGALRAFKLKNPDMQKDMCLLVGGAAKKCGTERNRDWQSQQTLWWQVVAYAREGPEYQQLLDRLYNAVSKNLHWKTALLSTGTQELTHSMGCPDPKLTVLTEEEFCSRLMKIRAQLQGGV